MFRLWQARHEVKEDSQHKIRTRMAWLVVGICHWAILAPTGAQEMLMLIRPSIHFKFL